MTHRNTVHTRLQADPQRTLLVLPTPRWPSARLLHTMRHYVERYGLAIEVLTEADLTALPQMQPDVCSGRLVRLPASHLVSGAPAQTFADRDGLLQALHAAGAWVHLLPRLESWAVLTDPLALAAVLARGVMVPPAGYEAFAPPPAPADARRRLRRPEDTPHFVDPWLGRRAEWHGIPTTVRRVRHD